MSHQENKMVKIACQNDAVPAEAQEEYIDRGLWVLDYGTGHSFRSRDYEGDRRKVGQIFSAVGKISRHGGYGTLRAEETDHIAVGRFGTNGIRLIEKIGTHEKNLKGLQFAEFAVLSPGEKHYDEADELAQTMGGTGAVLSDEKDVRMDDLLNRLEAEGRLRTPSS